MSRRILPASRNFAFGAADPASNLFGDFSSSSFGKLTAGRPQSPIRSEEASIEKMENRRNSIINEIMKRKLLEKNLYKPEMSAFEMTIVFHEERRKDFHVPKANGFPNHVSTFLSTGQFTDVVLKINGTELKAYKNILAAQSPVFAATFSNETMKEAQDNCVIIEDIDEKVVEQMLEFVNTNEEPSKLDEYALELLAVAEKYDMNLLKLFCEKKLIDKLSLDCAIETLTYANLYGSEKFTKSIIDFMTINPSILKSNEFGQLKKTNPQLAFKVLDRVLEIIGLTDPPAKNSTSDCKQQ